MKQIITVLFILICCECFAQSPSNSSVKNCKLTFYARGPLSQGITTRTPYSWVGHIFVILSADITWKATGLKFRDNRTMSFYKDGGMRNTEGRRSGQKIQNFTVNVTSQQYYQIMSFKNTFAKTKYVLNKNDCITFVDGVAKIARLKRPFRTKILLPVGYLSALKGRNKINGQLRR